MVKVLAAVLVVGAFTGTALAFQSNLPKELTEETRACVACHQEQNPGLYQMWGASKHYGANVSPLSHHCSKKRLREQAACG